MGSWFLGEGDLAGKGLRLGLSRKRARIFTGWHGFRFRVFTNAAANNVEDQQHQMQEWLKGLRKVT